MRESRNFSPLPYQKYWWFPAERQYFSATVTLITSFHLLGIFCLRTPSKQKSPKEEKDIDIIELLRNVDPKEYEKYARMYGITDYRGMLQAIEQLKKEKAMESGRPVSSCPHFMTVGPMRRVVMELLLTGTRTC